MIEIGHFTQWAGALALLLSLGTSIYTLLTSGSKKTAAALDAFQESCGKVLEKLEDSLSQQDRRIQALEGEMRHLPDKETIHRLELKLAELSLDVARVGASADQSARTGQRLEQYLFEHAKALGALAS